MQWLASEQDRARAADGQAPDLQNRCDATETTQRRKTVAGDDAVCYFPPAIDKVICLRHKVLREGRLASTEFPAAASRRCADAPRQNLARYGPRQLDLVQLVALVLGSGGKKSACATAQALLARFPNPTDLGRADMDGLLAIPDVGIARATRLVAACELGRRMTIPAVESRLMVRGPEDLAGLLHGELGGLDREHVLGVYLDSRHRVRAVRTISVGTLDASLVHPREVFRPAVMMQAAALVVAHNHPSGCAHPSGDDLELTRRLDRCGRLLGIELLDHVIVGDGDLVSIREYGWPSAP